MRLFLHRVTDTPLAVDAIARPGLGHRIAAYRGLWSTSAGTARRPIATIDEFHVDLADLLGLARYDKDPVIIEGVGRDVSFVFPAGEVPLLEVRADNAAERDRSAYQTIDERERAARATP